jgi:hypothetical protein
MADEKNPMHALWKKEKGTPHPFSMEALLDSNQRVEFTESPKGHHAREKWARRYDDLNGAPEGDDDR